MKIFEDIKYNCNLCDCNTLDIYLPENKCVATFVYFHGGGIEGGSKKKIFFQELLTQRGIAVVSADYRLYPDTVYPEFIRDAASALAWTFMHIEEYGGSKNIFVGGSSAGAYLSMMLCFDKRYLAVHNINADDIAGYIHDAGQPTTHFNILRERGVDSRRIIVDEAAPLYHVKYNSNYAPMLFVVSDDDMTNRYEQTMLMLKKTEVHIMKNSKHCNYLKFESENRELFEHIICEFILNNSKTIKLQGD